MEALNPKFQEGVYLWTQRLREDECLLWKLAEEKLVKSPSLSLQIMQESPDALLWRVVCLKLENKFGYLAKSLPYKRIKEFCIKIKTSKVEGGIVWELGKGHLS